MHEITQRKAQVIKLYCVLFLFIRSCTLKTRGSAIFISCFISCSPATKKKIGFQWRLFFLCRTQMHMHLQKQQL